MLIFSSNCSTERSGEMETEAVSKLCSGLQKCPPLLCIHQGDYTSTSETQAQIAAGENGTEINRNFVFTHESVSEMKNWLNAN